MSGSQLPPPPPPSTPHPEGGPPPPRPGDNFWRLRTGDVEGRARLGGVEGGILCASGYCRLWCGHCVDLSKDHIFFFCSYLMLLFFDRFSYKIFSSLFSFSNPSCPIFNLSKIFFFCLFIIHPIDRSIDGLFLFLVLFKNTIKIEENYYKLF